MQTVTYRIWYTGIIAYLAYACVLSFCSQHLSGVISAFSTDDRYSDDIHYVGGCMAASEALSWSTQMLLWNARPPTPVFQGGIEFPPTDLAGSETWRQVWKKRLDALVPLDENWIKHQNR